MSQNRNQSEDVNGFVLFDLIGVLNYLITAIIELRFYLPIRNVKCLFNQNNQFYVNVPLP